MIEKLEILIGAIRNSDQEVKYKREDLDFIVERVQHLADYVNAVVMMAVQIRVIRAKEFDQEDLVEKIQSIDNRRKMVHDVAIDACVQLDRLCVTYGCEPFCGIEKKLDNSGNVNSQNRHEFAVFIGKIINQIFMDEIYIDKTDEFVKEITKEQLNGISHEIEGGEM